MRNAQPIMIGAPLLHVGYRVAMLSQLCFSSESPRGRLPVSK